MRKWLASLLATLPVAAGAQPAEPDPASLALALAPLEAKGTAARMAPAVQQALREALEARGVGRVVGPGQLGLGEESGAEAAIEAGRDAGVDGVVTGLITQLGSRLSVDIRLRSTASGGVLGTYVAEVPIGDPLTGAADSLAERVVLGALNLVDVWGGGANRVAARTGPPGPGRGQEPPGARGAPFSMGDLAGHAMSIHADELEATEHEGGSRTLVFKQGVQVDQSDLKLTATQLSADYGPGEKQPHRLIATGDVELTQEDREAQCDRAVYESHANRIVCFGNARLRDGSDEIEGGEITFNLAERGVVVDGGTTLHLQPAGSSLVSEGARLGDHPADAPMQIRAQSLEAKEGPEPALNRIVLEGGVEVEQSGVILRSDRLEVLYPEASEKPERMEATGRVSLTQGEREARCDRAIYRAVPHRIECFGGDLDDSQDAVTGELIAFDLDGDRVTVNGRAHLSLAGRKPALEEGGTP